MIHKNEESAIDVILLHNLSSVASMDASKKSNLFWYFKLNMATKSETKENYLP